MFDDPLSDRDATPIACKACDGHYLTDRGGVGTYALVACRWCIRGTQTPAALARWERHRRRWRDSGVRRRKSDPGSMTAVFHAEDTKRFR